MFKKLKLKSEIAKYEKEIAELEQKRARSQAALVTAILNHNDPDDSDVEYFNNYTSKIEEARSKMHELMAELDKLNK